MIRATITSTVLLVLVAVSGHAVSLSDFAFEASIGGKYESNLLGDWTQLSDFTGTGHFAAKAYPLANLELSGSVDRSLIRLKESTEPKVDTSIEIFTGDTVYLAHEDLDEVLNSLSSVTTGVDLTWIPTSASSKFSLYFTGGIGRHAYDKRNLSVLNDSAYAAYDTIQFKGDTTIHKRDFKIYNTTDYNFTVGAGYQYSPRVNLRSELAFNHHEYTNAYFRNDMVNSNRIVDVLVGGNWSVAGTNVLDLEMGFTGQEVNRTFVDTAIIPRLNPPRIDTVIADGQPDHDVGTIYLSPRFSRQIGKRTGVNLTGTFRGFVSGSDIVVAGETAELLDPFATAWEGAGATLNIKTFLIPRLITNLSFGYWDKSYLKYEELRRNESGNFVPTPVDRDDTKKSVYLGFQMPLAKTLGGLTIEPVASVEYSDNSSTIDRYDYFNWDLSVGVSIRR